MSTNPPAHPLIIYIDDFPAYGLPRRTSAYSLAAEGRLDLRKFGRRTGITWQEAQRFINAAPTVAEAAFDNKAAIAASLRSRGHLA